ncbi:unnamed protein product [Alopecurus aequalis]
MRKKTSIPTTTTDSTSHIRWNTTFSYSTATTFTRGRHRSIADKPLELDRTFEPAFVRAGDGAPHQLSGVASLSIGSSEAPVGILLRRRDADFLGIVRFRIHSATFPRAIKSIQVQRSSQLFACFLLLVYCTALHI